MTFRACVQIILLNVYKMYHTMLLLCDTVVNVSNECNTMQHSHHVVELQWQTRERVAGDGAAKALLFEKTHGLVLIGSVHSAGTVVFCPY